MGLAGSFIFCLMTGWMLGDRLLRKMVTVGLGENEVRAYSLQAEYFLRVHTRTHMRLLFVTQ